MVQKFMRRDEVERLTGLPRSTIYDKMAKNEFPKSVKIDGRSVCWLESEIADWQASIIAKRDGSQRAA